MDNSLEQIKLLNLTEEDFTLLVEGLDALPERGLAADMMSDLIMGMVAKRDEEAQKKILEDREKKQRAQVHQKQMMKENVRILQGKLLMLKRYLAENKLLKDAYEAINLKSE